jgi:hypothetical protein
MRRPLPRLKIGIDKVLEFQAFTLCYLDGKAALRACLPSPLAGDESPTLKTRPEFGTSIEAIAIKL